MLEHYKQLFLYHHDTQKALHAYLTSYLSKVPVKAIELFQHITNAHQIWNARILREHELGVWQTHEWGEILSLQEQNHKKSVTIIESAPFNSIIHYKNSKGIIYENTVGDILFHVINHSTYHRGQIASLLRQSDIPPFPTDFIFYKRDLQ